MFSEAEINLILKCLSYSEEHFTADEQKLAIELINLIRLEPKRNAVSNVSNEEES